MPRAYIVALDVVLHRVLDLVQLQKHAALSRAVATQCSTHFFVINRFVLKQTHELIQMLHMPCVHLTEFIRKAARSTLTPQLSPAIHQCGFGPWTPGNTQLSLAATILFQLDSRCFSQQHAARSALCTPFFFFPPDSDSTSASAACTLLIQILPPTAVLNNDMQCQHQLSGLCRMLRTG